MKLQSSSPYMKDRIRGSLARKITILFILIISALTFSSASFAKEKNLSLKDRTKVFEEVWKIVNDNYYSTRFNGVNWNQIHARYRPQIESARDDQEFYAVLRRMIGELHDTHTRVSTPEERSYRERKEVVTVGVRVYEVDGKPTVIYVAPQSEADLGGVKPGMHVMAINGVSVTSKVAQNRESLGAMSSDRALATSAYGRLFRGEPGTTVDITLEGLDGQPFTVSLKRRVIDSRGSVSSRTLTGGFGYIKISAWESPVDSEFAAALSQMRNVPG